MMENMAENIEEKTMDATKNTASENPAGNMAGYVTIKMDDKTRKLLNLIFDDEFMEENTNFHNFEGFQYSSAVIANWKADYMVYAELLMDNFVDESTRFSTLNEMVMAATDRKFGKVAMA